MALQTVGMVSEPAVFRETPLFRRAWELPEIRMAWDALTLENGEL
jgi:hypothetical protein